MTEFELSDIEKVARDIIVKGKAVSVWCFDGEMGAGKTTLIKAICEQLGVVDNMSSPTFSIINEYLTDNKQLIYHFDFYRLDDTEDALRIGIDEYLESGKLCLIEWPGRLPELLPSEYVEISINFVKNNLRSYSTRIYGQEDQS